MNLLKVIRKFRDKDSKAFQILYEMFYDDVYRTAFLITRDHPLAEDATQEAFMKAFEKITTLNEPKKFSSWVKSIAARSAIDIMRSRKRLSVIDDVSDYKSEDFIFENPRFLPEEEVLEREFKKQLQQAIYSLNPIHRQIIVMRYYLDLNNQEIAGILDLPLGTVKSRLHRALKNLMVVVKNLEEFGPGYGINGEEPCNEKRDRKLN